MFLVSLIECLWCLVCKLMLKVLRFMITSLFHQESSALWPTWSSSTVYTKFAEDGGSGASKWSVEPIYSGLCGQRWFIWHAFGADREKRPYICPNCECFTSLASFPCLCVCRYTLMLHVLCFLILVYYFFANARGTQTFTMRLLKLWTGTSKNIMLIPMQWHSLRFDLFFLWQSILFFFFCLLKCFHFFNSTGRQSWRLYQALWLA